MYQLPALCSVPCALFPVPCAFLSPLNAQRLPVHFSPLYAPMSPPFFIQTYHIRLKVCDRYLNLRDFEEHGAKKMQ
jgi:hypothetical protein